MYTQEDVITFVEEENVKFIKLGLFRCIRCSEKHFHTATGAAARL